MIYVLAQNMRQAREFNRQYNIPVDQTRYINDVYSLMGIRDPEASVVFTGSWYLRSDLGQIMRRIFELTRR